MLIDLEYPIWVWLEIPQPTCQDAATPRLDAPGHPVYTSCLAFAFFMAVDQEYDTLSQTHTNTPPLRKPIWGRSVGVIDQMGQCWNILRVTGLLQALL